MAKAYGIQLVEYVGIPRPGQERVPSGWWLLSYDPEAHDGQGDAAWTPDPARALAFGTLGEAMECYRQQPKSRPLRPYDGLPNRPLMAATIEIVALP